MTDKIQWSGVTTAYQHKHNPTSELKKDTTKAVRKVYLLDVQWSDCPVEVEEQVKKLWVWAELGNDKYIFKTSIEDLEYFHDNVENYNLKEYDVSIGEMVTKPLYFNAIIQLLKERKVGRKDTVVIHYWW